MRNLTLLSTCSGSIPEGFEGRTITGTAFDLDNGTLYTVSEHVVVDEVNIQVWKVDGKQPLEFFSDITSPAVDAGSQVVSFAVIADTHTLCIIARCGDIAILPLDNHVPSQQFEIIGTVTPGHVLTASFSPDSSLLAIVTSPSNPTLILMDPTSFDVISSAPIITSHYGEDAPINVGWGSKATQFHGSLGKTAAQASAAPDHSTISPDDDTRPRISWRGDAQYFSVSMVQNNRRVLRVYNRQAALQSTAENVPGLEHPLAWRPSGGLIASTQRFGKVPGSSKQSEWALGKGRDARHDVIFFERNGLRHGEFYLRESPSQGNTENGPPVRCWGYRVRELAWNADSSILSIWVERETEDVVQLWTTGNYHWYLKLEIPARSDNVRRFTSVTWHPEDPVRLILSTNSSIIDTQYLSYTATSLLTAPLDTGLVAVIDGSDILLTPFRTQNVPPPMSSYRLPLAASPPIHLSFSPLPAEDSNADMMSALSASGTVTIHKVETNMSLQKGKREAIMAKEVWRGSVWAWVVGVLGEGNGVKRDVICLASVGIVGDSREVGETWPVTMPGMGGRLVQSLGNDQSSVVWQDTDGSLWEELPVLLPLKIKMTVPATSRTPTKIGSLPAFCASLLPFPSLLLSQTCTSYTIAGSHLIWTTTSLGHEAVFAPLSGLGDSLYLAGKGTGTALSQPLEKYERRRVERGARIVVAVPSSMSLVLQMPRGNLETVMPRPLVMEQVKVAVERRDYRTAFLACRKHRVDLNVLVQLDPDAFENNVDSFVEQLDDVDYINLFLSGLGRSTLSANTVCKLCDAVRIQLERRDIKKFINSILTAHVVKTPPDYESGLALLLKLRETNPNLVEDAVKYIIFLVDADRLFDTALGMYDFSLVLLVAQHSQKVSFHTDAMLITQDPREYLPFLRSLHALALPYQYFKIDDHLKRHTKALEHLSKAGPDHFGEAKSYVEKHRLHLDALNFWKGSREDYNTMLELYGDYLFERREFKPAALAFVQSLRIKKAMVAYEKALEWQELFDLVLREGITGDELSTIARRVADDLGSKQRHVDAARVFLDYADDVDEAISSFVRGSAWSEARRISTLHKRGDLLESVILPGTLEARSAIGDEIAEVRDLLNKQVGRLDELVVKKLAEPDIFYGVEDSNLENVDVMTDVSNPGTMYTRYTVANTASDRSRRTSRSKRKLDRKAGRKGTVEEEEYLLKSLTKLGARLDVILTDTRQLLPHMMMLSTEHVLEARDLQREVEALEDAMRTGIERIWTEREQASASVPSGDSVAEPSVKLTDKVPKPSLVEAPWKIGWMETSPV
ncbi:IkappaB kinase complex IKAP component [Hysterangium stoloniferum]|nr:IkappaB kinase complex IKAP component [Hysterangium stoloniferum]